MTEEEKKAVELKEAEAAAAKANEPSELEKALAEKDAEIARLSTEKENYKKGMLKAKGKLPKEEEESEEEESVDEKVARLVKESLLTNQLETAQSEKDELLKKALARNKELETAIKNRTQISTADTGTSNSTAFSPKDTVLTDEKIAKFKAMGKDDKWIEQYKKNLVKIR